MTGEATKSRFNAGNVCVVMSLLTRILEAGKSNGRSNMLLVSYTPQKTLYLRAFHELEVKFKIPFNVLPIIATIGASQGDESDIIIVY